MSSATLARPRRRPHPARPALYALALAVAAVVIVPVAYVALGGFRTSGQVAAEPVAWPDPWVFANYEEVLRSGSFWRQVGTSLLIAAVATAATVALGSGAAFALSRYAFRGREALFTFFTLGLLFPVGVGILPLHLLLRELHLVDTPIGVALPEAAFGLPITIVILRPFMRAIPGELEDAAAMDGCGRVGFFWRILLPLSLPALATVSILAFVTSWNAYLLPLLVLNDPGNWTLPLGVANWSTQYTQDTSKILAFTALSMLPALLFFALAERRIVGGLVGAVKG